MLMHRTQTSGFCARYGVTRLVWFGPYAGMAEAIEQEKRMKRWRRQWKIELIEAANPEWIDLYPGLNQATDAAGSRLCASLRPG
jgi:putative endonuclease